ncbi:hypothetical protein [Williamsia serinedens]|uniref:Immunity repressor n=1 Tax=Williamsia serinedens TaxID=391736 RepID=A0ABT1H625_9NOCA|nr:hypothetical protein [Williamsia serinedens]MCP2162692.1 hypothetical protein [Williamsia serinedens]
MPTIRDLIREALAAGKSVRDLEADSGYQVKFQTFQELSNSAPKQFPKKLETIDGMARALHATESAIVLAYASGLGIPVTSRSDFALRLPAGVDDLDEPMKKALISVVRAALTTGEADAVDPTTPQGAQGEADEGQKTKRSPFIAPRIAEPAAADDTQSDYDLAQRRQAGKSRGQRLREQQDADAESPGGPGSE